MAAVFRLDGKRALVTGAGRGLGKSIAEGLAAHGAQVAVTELTDRLADAEAVARAIGGLALPLDVREVAASRDAIARVTAAWDGLDILVNNAGMNIRQPAFEVTEDAWDSVLDTDLKGAFFAAQAAGRAMRERGGAIVNVASQNGLIAYYERAAYCSAKAGLINLTRLLAIEWAPHQIRVNAIAPTFVETELTAQMLADETKRADVLSRIPLGRLATADDVAGAVVFLASDEAAMVTGHTLVVDGGWTAR
jgi:NAD(P)-dependent dehydrogenase (short-subunit alcohol dehydrogenase family)